jgi:hypothetical protein
MGNRNPDVDAWFERYDNPLADLVQAVPELVVDDRAAGLERSRRDIVGNRQQRRVKGQRDTARNGRRPGHPGSA